LTSRTNNCFDFRIKYVHLRTIKLLTIKKLNIMTNLWKAGTLKAYYGYVAQLAIGLLGGFIVEMMTPNAMEMMMGASATGALVVSIIVAIASIAAFVYYLLGIKDMKAAAAGSNIEVGTSRLWTGAILGLCGSVLAVIPVISIIGALLGLAGFIVSWTGYSAIKANASDENAKVGGGKLATVCLLSVIAAVAAFIPAAGWIISLVLEVVALVFALQGWKLIAESELA
jgi:hypothetical protein